jgi:Tfp pilus assembly protein PilP
MGLVTFSALVVGLAAFLAGCGTENSVPSASPPVAHAEVQQPQQTPAAPVAAPAPAPPPVDPEPFVYSRESLRDPFMPFIKLELPKELKPKTFVPKTPLQRYATEELMLVGVIWGGPSRAKALIEDPEGKGYVAGVGTLVGDQGGGIVQIRPERVVIEERFVDVLGEETVRTVNMTLHKSEGEVSQ